MGMRLTLTVALSLAFISPVWPSMQHMFGNVGDCIADSDARSMSRIIPIVGTFELCCVYHYTMRTLIRTSPLHDFPCCVVVGHLVSILLFLFS